MENVLFVLLRRMRAPLIGVIIVYAVSILGFVLIPGRDPDGNVWRMDFFHAFYFVSFMGSTIGFGEIPYPFTGAQRLWATATIYASVFAWLYAIGALLSLIQDPAFRSLMTESRFRRGVRRIRDPFYLVCGYGDTGSLLVQALTESGIGAVVVDIDPGRVNAVALEDLKLPVPGLCADAALPEKLLEAGLTHRCCAGVVALTNKDHVNLKIAIATKLLNPRLRTICRAETHDAEANIASFGTEHVINPFDTFAGRLALALHSPGMYLLFEWLTAVPHEPLREPLFPPHGRWILCGYGRFGKAVHGHLVAEGVTTTIVEATPEAVDAPEGTILGRGTEAETLREAGVEDAVGIVAGTDDDANNLSIVMTAGELNPDLFMVARQNARSNDPVFEAAYLDLIMRRGSIVAHKIFALIRNPLLADFLELASRQGNNWANEVLSRIGGIAGTEAPHLWVVTVDEDHAPAIVQALTDGRVATVAHLCRDPRDRQQDLPCLALLVKRREGSVLVPEDGERLQEGDQILFCGRVSASTDMDWIVKNANVFNYIYTGEEHPGGYRGAGPQARSALDPDGGPDGQIRG